MKYKIREIYGGVNSPTAVELTIFLTGPDWYKLAGSPVWHRLESYIDQLEKDIPTHGTKRRYCDRHLH